LKRSTRPPCGDIWIELAEDAVDTSGRKSERLDQGLVRHPVVRVRVEWWNGAIVAPPEIDPVPWQGARATLDQHLEQPLGCLATGEREAGPTSSLDLHTEDRDELIGDGPVERVPIAKAMNGR
jgi:hypothetical protein